MTEILLPWTAGFVVMCATAIAYGLLLLLLPLLGRYACARPNIRSSHTTPTPQGGGIAVMTAVIAVVSVAPIFFPSLRSDPFSITILLAAAAALTFIGAIDDVHPLAAIPRLALQALVAGVVVATLPETVRISHAAPLWIERSLLTVSILWFVNLTNFMDGLDWMTVAESVPLTGGIAIFGFMGVLPANATVVALALCGAVIGFAPFNRPVARLFLGDAGSLPIGLLSGWLLILLAGNQNLTAALILPLYYLADATITLLRRFSKGEPIMQAHRTHFYQKALNNGLNVYQIVGRIFLTNIVLIALAFSTLLTASFVVHLMALAAGCVLVGVLLLDFSRARVSSSGRT